MKKEKRISQQNESKKEEKKICGKLREDCAWLQERYVHCGDFVERHFAIAGLQERNAVIFYFDGMANSHTVQDNLLQALLFDGEWVEKEKNRWKQERDEIQFMQSRLLPIGELTIIDSLEQGAKAMMRGDVVLLLEGCKKGFIIDAKGFPQRSVDRANNEKGLRGSQEAFTESFRTNTALIRRRIRTNQLKFEEMTLGKLTQTTVAIVYIEGIVNPNIVEEVQRRVKTLEQVDSILDSGCVEQYIEEKPFSIFPQIQYTERPDKVAASLLEGRVAIVVDGSPEVLLVPLLFVQLLQSPEDYYHRIIPGTFMRWIRYTGLLIATTFPSLYVAITSFHPEVLPFHLLLSIASAREGVPFPAFVEALLMELSFELLREASIRLPGAIGNTIGIVGALVIGDAAVGAHLVAPQMVIVVAITAIGSFTVPSIEASYPIRLIRFPLMLLAATFGLYGVSLGWILLIVYLIHLRSFGFPYFEPFAPLKKFELKDVFVRAPRWKMMVFPQFRAIEKEAKQEKKSVFEKHQINIWKHRGDASRGK